MKMKRFFSLLLVSAMLICCLAGCGKETSNDAPDVTPSQTEGSTQGDAQEGPITTEPITISVLTSRHTAATNNSEDIWFFKYLEYWMKEQGYNVTFNVQQTSEMDEQISLMFGTDNLPDLVWGYGLPTNYAVQYGLEEGMLLDWTPYIKETLMPNLCASFEKNPDALTASKVMGKGVYGLPYITSRGYMAATGSFGDGHRMYVNQTWLDACNLNIPTTPDELLNVLRAFKNVKSEDGSETIPLVSNANFCEKFIWTGLGYYGDGLSKYGTSFAIKDGKMELPAATEDYREFIKYMNTLYTEGLISQDWFTMDKNTARALMGNGVCGVLCDYGIQYSKDFNEWKTLPPITFGDNDEIVVSAQSTYKLNMVFASAKTKYPEVLAVILDFMYSDEGATLYKYGPKQGEDPLNLLDGWYLDENGQVTCKLVENGTYPSITDYAWDRIQGNMYVGDTSNVMVHVGELCGLSNTATIHTHKDAVTGRDIITEETVAYTTDNADGRWRHENMLWNANTTAIRIPSVYMTSDDSFEVAELKAVIENYITSESAKFITGIRPLSELDDYFKELKSLGVDRYIELYNEAFSSFMEDTFK